MCPVLLALLLLLAPPLAHAFTTHGVGDAAVEMQAYFGDGMTGYVPVGGGCLPATSATTTLTMPACQAYIRSVSGGLATLRYVHEPAAVSLPFADGDGTYFVLGRTDPAVIPAGWTCQPGTHYCWLKAATAPPQPAATLLLVQATVASSAVSAVSPMAPSRPLTLQALSGFLRPEDFGARGDGLTDDSAAITRTCLALASQPTAATSQRGLWFPANARYYLQSGVVCNLPEQTDVLAWGAYFFMDQDSATPMFDLNPDGDCTAAGACKNPLRNLRWHGGTFRNTASAKTQSTAFLLKAIRGVTLEELNIEGFWMGLEVQIQDNFYLRRSTIRAVLTTGGYALRQRPGVLHLNTPPSEAIVLENNLFAGDETCAGMVALLGHRMGGTTVQGNVFAGECTYHLHFQSGEEDAAFAARAVLIQRNHFEQALAGTYYIWLEASNVRGWTSSVIRNNRLGAGTAGFTGVRLDRCRGCEVSYNEFNAPTPTGVTTTEIELRAAESQNIMLCGNTHDVSTTFLKLVGVLREAVTICDQILSEPLAQGIITGWDLDLKSDGTTTIDMTTAFSELPPTGAKGYWVAIQCRDSGSAGTTVYVIVHHPLKAGATGVRCDVSGAANNNFRYAGGYVDADGNADITAEVQASGTDTMEVRIRVQAIHQ